MAIVALYRSPEFDYQGDRHRLGARPRRRRARPRRHLAWKPCCGQLEVVDNRIAGRHRALSELHPAEHRLLPAGSMIGLLPPHDLRSCRNAGKRETTVSRHIYGKHLKEVTRYVHVEASHYRAEKVRLVSV